MPSDLRHALRSLRQAPAFSLAAILTCARWPPWRGSMPDFPLLPARRAASMDPLPILKRER